MTMSVVACGVVYAVTLWAAVLSVIFRFCIFSAKGGKWMFIYSIFIFGIEWKATVTVVYGLSLESLELSSVQFSQCDMNVP